MTSRISAPKEASGIKHVTKWERSAHQFKPKKHFNVTVGAKIYTTTQMKQCASIGNRVNQTHVGMENAPIKAERSQGAVPVLE